MPMADPVQRAGPRRTLRDNLCPACNAPGELRDHQCNALRSRELLRQLRQAFREVTVAASAGWSVEQAVDAGTTAAQGGQKLAVPCAAVVLPDLHGIARWEEPRLLTQIGGPAAAPRSGCATK